MVFLELLFKFSFFFTSPCCCIPLAVLVSADDKSYSDEYVVSLLIPVLDPVARASCLLLLMLCEKIIVSYHPLSAYYGV